MTQIPLPTDPQGRLFLSRDQRVASSAGWLAVSLNLGCQGLGYIYQRRWGAFWIGGASAVAAAVVLGVGSAALVNSLASQGRLESPEDRTTLIAGGAAVGAYAGVIAVGVGTAVEAGLAVNRARRRNALVTPVQDV